MELHLDFYWPYRGRETVLRVRPASVIGAPRKIEIIRFVVVYEGRPEQAGTNMYRSGVRVVTRDHASRRVGMYNGL